MCPHTMCVLILLHMCPDTGIQVVLNGTLLEYTRYPMLLYMCPHTAAICVLILLLCMCPHTAICVVLRALVYANTGAS
jgi:hypothetical protein